MCAHRKRGFSRSGGVGGGFHSLPRSSLKFVSCHPVPSQPVSPGFVSSLMQHDPNRATTLPPSSRAPTHQVRTVSNHAEPPFPSPPPPRSLPVELNTCSTSARSGLKAAMDVTSKEMGPEAKVGFSSDIPSSYLDIISCNE